MRSLRSSASRIISASKPAPAMTAKRSFLKRPTSILRVCPCSPICTACSSSRGMPRLVANRFAVPAGSTASGILVPASTPTQRRTVPSPPQAKTSSAPASSARSTCSGAFLAFGTSYQSGSSTPALRERAPQRRQPVAERLLRVCDDRDLHDAGCGRREEDRARGPARGVRERGDAGGAAREQQHQHRADADRARPRRRRAGGACRGTCASRRRRPEAGARPPRPRRANRAWGTPT